MQTRYKHSDTDGCVDTSRHRHTQIRVSPWHAVDLHSGNPVFSFLSLANTSIYVDFGWL